MEDSFHGFVWVRVALPLISISQPLLKRHFNTPPQRIRHRLKKNRNKQELFFISKVSEDESGRQPSSCTVSTSAKRPKDFSSLLSILYIMYSLASVYLFTLSCYALMLAGNDVCLQVCCQRSLGPGQLYEKAPLSKHTMSLGPILQQPPALRAQDDWPVRPPFSVMSVDASPWKQQRSEDAKASEDDSQIRTYSLSPSLPGSPLICLSADSLCRACVCACERKSVHWLAL